MPGRYLFINQRDAADENTLTRIIEAPGSLGVLAYDDELDVPVFYALGAGFSLQGTELSVPGPDLSRYALKSDVPPAQDLSGYALKSQIPDVSGYALKSQLPDLSPYALKSQIPATADLSAYALKSEIPPAQVQPDWSAATGLAAIKNKPTIPAAQVQADWNATSGVAAIQNKPSIPAAQVQSDWNATTGPAAIANKPAQYSPQTPVLLANPAVNTAYQAPDKTKPCRVMVNARSALTVTLLALQSNDKVEIRIAPTAAGALKDGVGGFSVGVWETGLTGISVSVGMGLIDGGQMSAEMPAGWYFSINRLTGTTATIVSCFTQATTA